MSTRTVVGLYLLAALTFGIVHVWPAGTVITTDSVAAIAGGALGIGTVVFVLSGLIPAVVWIIGHFRPADNRATWRAVALAIWAPMGIVVALLMILGQRANFERSIAAEFGDSNTLSDDQRTAFAKGAKAACISDQRKNSLNRAASIADQQINSYCDCTTDYLTRAVTVDDIKHFARYGAPSEAAKEKQTTAAMICSPGPVLRR
jgi:hypothetical protein